MKKIIARIAENKKVAPGFYRMRIESAYLAKNTRPGQFFKVRCSDLNDPLLRRPLGANRILKNGIEMLYEVVGRGTELLSGKKAGEYLDIMGPLGNGFDLKLTPNPQPPTPILIAGGIGVAPLLALAEKIVNSFELGVESKKKKIYVLIGAKTKNHILCEPEFRKLGCRVFVSTEDGSKGKKGLVTGLLSFLLSTISSEPSTIYACGPDPMLKATSNMAHLMNIPCQVSLDERMACGVGVCLGCPVKIKGQEYKMVCKDGPVFDSKEIAW